MSKYFILLFSLCCSVSFVKAQDRDIKFEKISVGEGLSHSSVFDIVQDSLGYMWFATQDGQINRYDGYEFNTFRPDKSNTPGIPYQNIRRMLIDSRDYLWLGGSKGVVRYDNRNECFKSFFLFAENENTYVTGLVNDEANNVWFSTANGKLYILDPATDTFSKISFQPGDNVISAIETIKTKGDYIYIGSQSGLYIFNRKSYTVSRIMFDDSDHFIRDIELDNENGIWIGTEEDGLYLLGKDHKFKYHYINIPGVQNSLVDNKVRDIEIGEDGKIWIGTFKGLSILNPGNGFFDNYVEESGYNYSLSQNSVRCIFTDKDKGFWLGTYYGGLSYYHPNNIKFNLINKTSGDPMLSDNVVNVVLEDNKKNLWVGTNDHGLNCLDIKNRKVVYYKNGGNTQGGLSSNNIKSILELDDGTLLLGTHWGGLNHFYPVTGRSVVYKNTPQINSLADDRVTSLLKDHQNRIWVGTFRGVQDFDPKTGRFLSHYVDSNGQRLSSDLIACLCEDSKKRIWIGTFSGLNVFYPEDNLFESFLNIPVDSTSISSNEITCVFEDYRKRIWIGTNNGLNLFDEINRSFKRFNKGTGLVDDYISGILEDKNDNLWISTAKGLMKFNLATRDYVGYSMQDGLQSTQYNPNAALITTDGMMVFGGINGINTFYPDKIGLETINPKVLFTKLLVNNKYISVGDSSKILGKSISETKSIELKSTQNLFSLHFVAINFYNKEKVTYMYKLDGYSSNWTLAHESRSVSFANLNPGDYVFEVKVNSQHTTDKELVTSLKVTILPPWHRSWVAYLLYLFILTGLLIFAYKIIRERVRTADALKLERIEKQKLEEIHKIKLQFFTNISHEFKTPLSLIIAPLEKLMESKTSNEWYNKQIDVVYKNSRRLLSLIDQLLEFRKAESGKLELKVSKGNHIVFLYDIYVSFASLAKSRDIIYKFEKQNEELNGYFDKSFLEKIMFNLLSNAFKYTPSAGNITLRIGQKGDEILISVIDTGRGIPKEQLPFMYDSFHTVKENNPVGGSGIGLAFTKRLVELHHGTIIIESEPDKGSAFTVRIPLKKEAYLLSEISEEVNSMKAVEMENIPGSEIETVHTEVKLKDFDRDLTILIVDDNQDLVNYLHENLSTIYNADVAYDGLEALEKVKSKNYDLIISDVMMPNMDGLTFCKKIKRNIKTSHIPFILLTVKASIDQQVEGLDIGADDYLGKPFSLRLLESKIDNLIKSRERLKEVYQKGTEIHPEQMAYNTLDQEFLKKAVAIVEQNLSDTEFSVDIFAKEMFMSRSNLHLKFKAITGESVSDFVRKIRFRKTIELLETGRYNISEISYMVGFASPSYFSNRFRKYFGYLPTDYLKKNK